MHRQKTMHVGTIARPHFPSGLRGPARSRVPRWRLGAHLLQGPISHGLSRRAGSYARPHWRLHACYASATEIYTCDMKARGAGTDGVRKGV
ncbi:hypothetical protein AURDEDRAFT_142569 [Auricularia subglabra TFB-10046 SS5]|nr:hypothetical protein AURDEDRAFT_142569 [Auricularia subglabra TFB-10046 SS5]